MSLHVYYKDTNGIFVEVSEDNDILTPITTVHDGKSGDIKTICLYLRNDQSSKWYSNIRIKPTDLVDANPYGDVIYTETGWGVKLNKGGTEPTQAEWNNIDWGIEISMDNIGSNSLGDTATYAPFYYLITCPPNANVENKEDIVLEVSYTENAVI